MNTSTINRIVTCKNYGPPSVLSIQSVIREPPKKNEVQIAVKSFSLNPIDSWMRRGYGHKLLNQKLEFKTNFPIIDTLISHNLDQDIHETKKLGRDCSGVVVALGPNVWDFKVGDEVIAAPSPFHGGTYADFVNIFEGQVVKKPTQFSFCEATSVTFVGITSCQALMKYGRVKKGEEVFIGGGSGSIGQFSVQLLKSLGCKVVVTSSLNNFERMKILGADEVIDYHQEGYQDNLKNRFDLVLETRFGEQFERESLSFLKGGPSVDHEPFSSQFSKERSVGSCGRFISLCGPLIKRFDSDGIIYGIAKEVAQGWVRKKIYYKSIFGIQFDYVAALSDKESLQQVFDLCSKNLIKPFIWNKTQETNNNSIPLQENPSGPFFLSDIVLAHQQFDENNVNGKLVLETSNRTFE